MKSVGSYVYSCKAQVLATVYSEHSICLNKINCFSSGVQISTGKVLMTSHLYMLLHLLVTELSLSYYWPLVQISGQRTITCKSCTVAFFGWLSCKYGIIWPFTLQSIMFGSTELTNKENIEIFSHVQHLITVFLFLCLVVINNLKVVFLSVLILCCTYLKFTRCKPSVMSLFSSWGEHAMQYV